VIGALLAELPGGERLGRARFRGCDRLPVSVA
jgi:hypothetical protein